MNPNDPAFGRYGGRGIQVDPRWDSFSTFLADMGERPDGTTLDREDNDADCTPINCRWATPTEQQVNRRVTRFIEADGKRQCLTHWAKDLGMDPAAIRGRMRSGWPSHLAVTMPKGSLPHPRIRGPLDAKLARVQA